MFRLIGYKLVLYIALLMLSVAGAAFLFAIHAYIYGVLCMLAVLFSLRKLHKHYKQFNDNIVFLLNAIENGDYAFNFTEAKLSRRERELNMMLNRIKDILTKARKEVIENETFLSVIVESISTGIILLDENGNVRISNRAVNQLLGLPVFTHLNQLKAIDESFPQLLRNLGPNDQVQIKGINEREEISISVRVSRVSLKNGGMKIITLNNIGNELEAREMESWVRLIRVMTHEIMNSIAPITSLTDTLLFSYKNISSDNGPDTIAGDEEYDGSLKADTVEALETISQTARGLIAFVESYRKFTGVPKPKPVQFALISLIEQVMCLESAGIKAKGIRTRIETDNESVALNADEQQITQVLVNLVKNAVEAIESKCKGQIVVKATETDGRVQIDVCNNGDPIPADVVPNIFVPFFTTKSSGTGVGLSVSRYIMRLHGGNLKHHTKDGWTIFSMVF